MLLTIPIKNSGEIRYIDRLEDLISLAATLKCQEYYMDPYTKKIYGFYSDFHSLIETDLPFNINAPLLMEASCLTIAVKELIHNTKSFFYSTNYPYILFSENRRADFINNNLSFTYGDNETGPGVIDNMTGNYINDCIITVNPDVWYLSGNFRYVIDSYYARIPYLGTPKVINKYNEDPVVLEVLNNKITEGTKLETVKFITPNNSYKTYTFYIFKSLLSTYTRVDSLDLYIQDDLIEPNKFMATFRVTKKNKLKNNIPELGSSFIIDTHVFMFNLA